MYLRKILAQTLWRWFLHTTFSMSPLRLRKCLSSHYIFIVSMSFKNKILCELIFILKQWTQHFRLQTWSFSSLTQAWIWLRPAEEGNEVAPRHSDIIHICKSAHLKWNCSCFCIEFPSVATVNVWYLLKQTTESRSQPLHSSKNIEVYFTSSTWSQRPAHCGALHAAAQTYVIILMCCWMCNYKSWKNNFRLICCHLHNHFGSHPNPILFL